MHNLNGHNPQINYKKYPLSQVVTVKEILSADLVVGQFQPQYPHTHQDAWELCYCQEGSVTVTQRDRTRELRPGQALFTPPGVEHDSMVRDPDSVIFYIAFTCTDTYLQSLKERSVWLTHGQEKLLRLLIEEIKSAFEHQNNRLRIRVFIPGSDSPIGAEQMISSYLEQFLISILRDLTAKNGTVVTGEGFVEAIEGDLVNRINRYIHRHLKEPITVQKLCSEFHYGRTKISTTYKRVMGIGINSYITRERLEQAKQLLEDGSYSVTAVSEMTGFSSPQYFSKKFSAVNGCSPSEYAEQFV